MLLLVMLIKTSILNLYEKQPSLTRIYATNQWFPLYGTSFGSYEAVVNGFPHGESISTGREEAGGDVGYSYSSAENFRLKLFHKGVILH